MTPILTGVIASGISGHLTPPWSPEGGYDALATVKVPSGGVTSITFSGIPAGYKHLQVRAMHLYSGGGSNVTVSYNGSINNNISHFFYGTGAATAAGNDSSAKIISFQSGATSTAFAVAIWDFPDYSNTSKNKVLRGIVGQDVNGTAGLVGVVSALSVDTSAINSLTFTYGGASFVENTHFALYGVK